MPEYITDDTGIASDDSDEESSDKENSDKENAEKENSNEENSDEENSVQNVFRFYIFDISNNSSLYTVKKSDF